MTERYLSQLAVIAANDWVSTMLFIGAALIVASLYLSRTIPGKMRGVVQLITGAVCFITYAALLISPFLGGS